MICCAEQDNQLKPAEGKSGAIPICATTSAGLFIGDKMKMIPLTQGKVAIVDDCDFDWLSQRKWYAQKIRNSWYACRNEHPHKILMHREILGLKYGDAIKCDHRNGNGLNNQQYNLRNCTHAENIRNQKLQKRNKSSAYKGVYWNKKYKKWYAQIRVNGCLKRLGQSNDEIEAAKIYNIAAKRYFGEFARLNPC